MVDVQRRLERVSAATEAAWLDAMGLAEGRRLWESLVPHLDSYPGDGLWLGRWYRDWLLAGCRRLLDETRGTTSLTRAFRLLQPVADQLTPALVLERWRQAGTEGLSDESHAREALEALTGGVPLTSAYVNGEVRRLRKRHARAVTMANERVAHRTVEPTVDSLAIDSILALEDDVLDAVFRLHRVVNGSHLMTRPVRGQQSRPLVEAIRLFDWRKYHDAIERADLELGPWADRYYEVVDVDYVVDLEAGD